MNTSSISQSVIADERHPSDVVYLLELVSLVLISLCALGITLSPQFFEKQTVSNAITALIILTFVSIFFSVVLLIPIMQNGRSRISISWIIVLSVIVILLDFAFVLIFIKRSPSWGNFVKASLLNVKITEDNINTGFAFLHLFKTCGVIMAFYALARNKDNIVDRLDQYSSESTMELVKSLAGLPGVKGHIWLTRLVSLRYWKRPYMDYRLQCFFCIGTFAIALPLNDLSNLAKYFINVSIHSVFFWIWQGLLVIMSMIGYMAWIAHVRVKTTILHLSDIHISSEQQAETWSSQLIDDLFYSLKQTRVGWIIISGDIANKADTKEYLAAALLISKLCAQLKIPKERVVISPGNHDVSWNASEVAYKTIITDPVELKKAQSDEQQAAICIPHEPDGLLKRDEELYRSRFLNFSQFHELCTDRTYALTYQDQATIHCCQKSKILILSLNSAWEIDHHYKKRASINEISLSKALDQIRVIDPEREFLKIAVWHHPMKLESDAPINHQGFVQRLITHGFRVVLNGHVHMAAVSIYNQDVSLKDGRLISMLSAGTFGAPTKEWRPGYPLQYNFISVYKNRLIIDTRCRTEPNGAWQPDSRWTRNENDTPRPWYEVRI